MVEQRPFKAWVAGSNPAALTNFKERISMALRERAYVFLRPNLYPNFVHK